MVSSVLVFGYLWYLNFMLEINETFTQAQKRMRIWSLQATNSLELHKSNNYFFTSHTVISSCW